MTGLIPLKSEMLISGAWQDITSRIRREDASGIRITGGLRGEGASRPTGSAMCTFKNGDDFFSYDIPGTTNYQLIGQNSQIRHRLRSLYDTFNRTVANGIGTSDSGEVWTTSGGSASDYSVAPSVATLSLGSVNVRRQAVSTGTYFNVDITGYVGCSVSPSGNAIEDRLQVRYVDDSNFIDMRFFRHTSNLVGAIIRQMVGGVEIFSSEVTISPLATDNVYFRFRVENTKIKLWCGDAAQPDSVRNTWTLEMDTTWMTVGKIRWSSSLSTGNTNTLPVLSTWGPMEVSDWRFWGELPAWSPQADETGNERYVGVEAGDLLRRLKADNTPLPSPVTFKQAGVDNITALDIWPMSDASGSTQYGNYQFDDPTLAATYGAVLPRAVGVIQGVMNANSFTGAAGVQSIPSFSATGRVLLPVKPYTNQGAWQVQTFLSIPSLPTAGDKFLFTIFTDGLDSITTQQVKIGLQDLGGGTSFSLFMDRVGTSSSATRALIHTITASEYGKLFFMTLTHWIDSGTLKYTVVLYDQDGNAITSTAGLDTGSVGTVSLIAGSGFDLALWDWGGVAFYSDGFVDPTVGANVASAMTGYPGELSGARLTRIMGYVGMSSNVRIEGSSSDTTAMGPMRSGASLIDTIYDCVDVDQGMLYGATDFLGFIYRTRVDLYNQTAYDLDASSGTLSTFMVNATERKILNDVTARRLNGSYTRVIIRSGRFSSQSPPDGVGTYPEDQTWNLSTDTQTISMADWRAHVYSWYAPKVTSFGVLLSKDSFDGSPLVREGMAGTSIGDRITLNNPRDFISLTPIPTLIIGYDETIANFEHPMSWYTQSYEPYIVGAADSVRVQGDQTLNTAVNSSATTWLVDTNSGPSLITDDTQDGFQYKVDGEIVTVTDVAPATISYVSVGTAASAASGTSPLATNGPAGVVDGDLVLIFASTRNSGTGIPQTPGNWWRFPVFGANDNCQVFGRIRGGGWTMPSITFTNGAANEDVIAQAFAVRGNFSLAGTEIGVTDVPSLSVYGASVLTAATQNVIYPGVGLTNLDNDCVAFYFGWKQDDWTSVASGTGFTEIQEAVSTAGNDAAQVCGYKIMTTPASFGAEALTVTGGAAAISRGGVLIIKANYQSCTVARGVAGLASAHAAGVALPLTPEPHFAW